MKDKLFTKTKVLNFFIDKETNKVCFYGNGWCIFTLDKTRSCLSVGYEVAITDVTNKNVTEAIYMIRCLNKVRNTILMSYKELSEKFESLDNEIKDSVKKNEDIIILAHDTFLEYKGNIPFDDEDFEDADYFIIYNGIEKK